MARTIPIHSGYTIINGSGTGTNSDRIDVWIEYAVISQDKENNRSRVTAYFYTALKDGESSGTWSSDEGYSSFSVNGVSGTGLWNDHAYDFRETTPMRLGSYNGYITHTEDGTKTIAMTGSFSTESSHISGGNVSGNVTLPTIDRGLFRVRRSGAWVIGIPYIKSGGTWRQGQAYVKAGGIWKNGV